MFRFSLIFGFLFLVTGIRNCYSLEYRQNNIQQFNVESTDGQQKDDRIIGGGGVTPGQAPFMASLRGLNNVHFCGGVVVANRYILTSGLCTAGRSVNSINVVVGSVLLASGGITHRSANIITFPGFRPDTLMNDSSKHPIDVLVSFRAQLPINATFHTLNSISLIYTATAIAFTNDVQPIAINQNINVSNTEAFVYGWGMYTETGEYVVNYLHSLTTYPISNEDCISNLTEDNARRITDNKICSFSGKGYGPCFGDAGGPLIAYIQVPFEPPSAQLIGILSYHVSCAVGFPDIYERIAHYALWVKSHLV